ncbi:META domain-containing protein [Pedobacter sp. UYP30]|uniref:META domain-containing protein n=1 Tax=Pedobacter sp. UYP30 TaxID=1756400 RepID=UPI0033986A08
MNPTKKGNAVTSAQLDNTQWELSSLPGTTLPTDAKATLNFGDSLKVNGKSFCNGYGGQAEMVDGKFELKNVFGTKMFCKESAVAETAYLKGLNETTTAKLRDGNLVLLNNEKELLIFKKTN